MQTQGCRNYTRIMLPRPYSYISENSAQHKCCRVYGILKVINFQDYARGIGAVGGHDSLGKKTVAALHIQKRVCYTYLRF